MHEVAGVAAGSARRYCSWLGRWMPELAGVAAGMGEVGVLVRASQCTRPAAGAAGASAQGVACCSRVTVVTPGCGSFSCRTSNCQAPKLARWVNKVLRGWMLVGLAGKGVHGTTHSVAAAAAAAAAAIQRQRASVAERSRCSTGAYGRPLAVLWEHSSVHGLSSSGCMVSPACQLAIGLCYLGAWSTQMVRLSWLEGVRASRWQRTMACAAWQLDLDCALHFFG